MDETIQPKAQEDNSTKAQEISLDMLGDLKAPEGNIFKPKFEVRTTCTISEVPKVYYPEKDKDGVDKNGKKFNKVFFTIRFKLDKPINNIEDVQQAFSFRIYDGTTISWGTSKSSTGALMDLIAESMEGITKSSPLKAILTALEGKKCQVISKQVQYQSQLFDRYAIAAFI